MRLQSQQLFAESTMLFSDTRLALHSRARAAFRALDSFFLAEVFPKALRPKRDAKLRTLCGISSTTGSLEALGLAVSVSLMNTNSKRSKHHESSHERKVLTRFLKPLRTERDSELNHATT